MEYVPLADKLRPIKFSQFIGQSHLVGNSGMLTKLIDQDIIPSMIFWGPPGSGKTTLAKLIALHTKANFIAMSAVTAKLEDIRKIFAQARENTSLYSQRTILFMDEIHRFNKAQQDAFLPFVEDGTIILIGATTENPSFEVIGPLLSRTRVLVLKQLNETELKFIARRALKFLHKKIQKNALQFLIEVSGGDSRILLNTLEIADQLTNIDEIILKDIEDAFQKKQLYYDKQGDEHYNIISAFIKSMRASDVDSALYYLARMVHAGEDPLFIARRMVVFASEDVSSPTALVVANAVFRACETIGYPECQENLAAGVVYLAQAKKDRSSYDAYMTALQDVQRLGNLPVPMKIRNAPTKLMKDLGYGKDYEIYTTESLLPEKLKGRKYFRK